MDDLKQKKDTEEQGVPLRGSDFITEKIKQRPVNKKKLLRRTLITAAMAVVFALVACLTFLLLEPVISNWLYPEEEPEPIEFPAETEEILPQDMIVDDSEMEQTQVPEEVPLQDAQIEQVLDSIELGVQDYSAMYSQMAEVAQKAANAMVMVTGSVSSVDWFNNPYESQDQTSGIIVAKLEKELLILVNYEQVIDAESIVATFCNGTQAEARLLRKDPNTRLAVLSVRQEDIGQEVMQAVEAADLAASSDRRSVPGSPIIAIGSPLGNGESVCYGVITSNNTTLNLVDAYYKILTTDIYGSRNASGVLINLSGQVLGVIDSSHNSADMENLISAIGITELRKVIERMSNERDQTYLGTRGTDVTIEVHEKLGVPYGAYIAEIEMDSPAMEAGIQSGDVITKIGERTINSYGDLVRFLMEAAPEESISVTLMRQGPEEYVQMNIGVVLGVLE